MLARLVAASLVLAACSSLAAVGVVALFDDQDVAGSNPFTTGTIAISVSPTSTLVTLAGMEPGSSVIAPLVVTNAGLAPVRYAVTVTATNADGKSLQDQVRLEVRTGDSGAATSCTGFTGTWLYAGPLSGRPAGRVLGDTAQGSHDGDRSLVPSATETLCFRFELPLSTPNSHRDATTTATFSFSGEQVANNP